MKASAIRPMAKQICWLPFVSCLYDLAYKDKKTEPWFHGYIIEYISIEKKERALPNDSVIVTLRGTTSVWPNGGTPRCPNFSKSGLKKVAIAILRDIVQNSPKSFQKFGLLCGKICREDLSKIANLVTLLICKRARE